MDASNDRFIEEVRSAGKSAASECLVGERTWEDCLSLNNHVDCVFEVLGRASNYRAEDGHPTDWGAYELPIDEGLQKDHYPLPVTRDREGYYGPHHFSYWASGLRDMCNLLALVDRHSLDLQSYLDLGCASGRVIRHFSTFRPDLKVYGADINRKHVEWVSQHLDKSIIVFQNTSIPHLPLPDNSIDLISAFSVFTHIECFENTWLMELNRILRPGGLAWVTVHTEKTWAELRETWPLYKGLSGHVEFEKIKHLQPMPKDHLVFRRYNNRSYSSNVFYSYEYLRKSWSKIFDIIEEHHRLPGFQDVVVLRKR